METIREAAVDLVKMARPWMEASLREAFPIPPEGLAPGWEKDCQDAVISAMHDTLAAYDAKYNNEKAGRGNISQKD